MQSTCRIGNTFDNENKPELTKITSARTNLDARKLAPMLVKARKNSKHKLEHDGPYEITQVNDNGTIRFQKGIVNDATNIGRIKPFHKQQKTKFTTESNRPDHRGECSRPVLQ
jgi:hypothetical protein